jgi:hypothetical protein
MSAQEDDKLDQILTHVEKLSRGMYGDPDNGVHGLIRENMDREIRLKAVEDNQKKVKYWIAGFSIAIPSIILFIKQKLGL